MEQFANKESGEQGVPTSCSPKAAGLMLVAASELRKLNRGNTAYAILRNISSGTERPNGRLSTVMTGVV
jgi:hypothetical protein